jgi:hypothetical protein
MGAFKEVELPNRLLKVRLKESQSTLSILCGSILNVLGTSTHKSLRYRVAHLKHHRDTLTTNSLTKEVLALIFRHNCQACGQYVAAKTEK